MSHASDYAQLGNTWYTLFVTAEEYEDVTNLSSGYAPYGDGSNATFSPIIALGEGWAYYMGYCIILLKNTMIITSEINGFDNL